MPINVRFAGDVVILSNFGRLLNDPRHFDAIAEVRELLDGGRAKFVFDLSGIGSMGPTALGLLVTLTREVRRERGDAVLARMSRATSRFIEEMRLDDLWDAFDSVEDAAHHLDRRPGRPGP